MQAGVVTFSPPHVFTASDLCGHGVAEAVRREDYWKNMFQQINQSLETLKYISLYISLYCHLEDGPILTLQLCVIAAQLSQLTASTQQAKERISLNHES